jgi:hypothetical protein
MGISRIRSSDTAQTETNNDWYLKINPLSEETIIRYIN